MLRRYHYPSALASSSPYLSLACQQNPKTKDLLLLVFLLLLLLPHLFVVFPSSQHVTKKRKFLVGTTHLPWNFLKGEEKKLSFSFLETHPVLVLLLL